MITHRNMITSAFKRGYLFSQYATYYFLGAGFASIFNQFVPEVRVIAESAAPSEENFSYILRKRMDLGFSGFKCDRAGMGKEDGHARNSAHGHGSYQRPALDCKETIVQLEIDVNVGRLLCYYTAWTIDQGKQPMHRDPCGFTSRQ
jgi:hypothetical protein